jgi:hypothetical protein
MSRMQFGERHYNQASRFISDMGDQFIIPATEPQIIPDQEFYSDEPFCVGERIRSASFGTGTITDIDGLALTVEFDGGHTKKLNAEYARLERI